MSELFYIKSNKQIVSDIFRTKMFVESESNGNDRMICFQIVH